MKRGPGSSLLLPAAGWIVALALASVLGGCAGIPGITVPREVKVPVPVPCVDPKERPQRPAVTSLDDLLAMDPGTRTLRTWAALERLAPYTAELEAIVEGCSRIPVPANRAGGQPMK